MTIQLLFFFSLIGGLFSLVGGFTLLIKPALTHKLITPLISFGAGAFLGAVFLDILPEALESSLQPQPVLVATLAGFLSFFLLERVIMKYSRRLPTHSHSEHTEPLPFLLVLGDLLHNFLDGVVIAIAFAANPVLGLPTALAIAAHEIPQEIGDFSILLNLGWSRAKVVTVNILQSLATVPGVFIGYFLGQSISPHLPLLLGATAGIFLYIAASDLVPELHHRSGHKYAFRLILPMLGSIIMIAFFSSLAPGH